MYFCFKWALGPRIKLVDYKNALNTPNTTQPVPVIYTTGRSKVVVSVFILPCVVLWFTQWEGGGGGIYIKYCLVLCPWCFSPFSITGTSFEKEELCLHLVCLFVLLVFICVSFLFLLVLRIGCDLGLWHFLILLFSPFLIQF